MYTAIARNKRNTIFIILLFLVIIGGLGLLASYIYNSWTIVIITLVVASVYALIQYFAAGSQAIMMSGAVEITDQSQNPRLWRIVENLCITSGMQMPRLYIVNDPSPNAFATGRDPKHAMVAATTGILDLLDDSELEGVMAHELSHVRNYDIRVSMIVFGLVVAVGFIADMLMRMAFFGGRGRNNNSSPIVLVIGMVAMIIAPFIAAIVQASVSRQREYLADASGAMLTRHPEGLANALNKISGGAGITAQSDGSPLPMRRQSSSMAHMWFADPMKQGFMAKMFSTHPPIGKRIQRLLGIGEGF
ncbi:MAG: M48 family metalloprotease [Microbacteriaceae bacterium]